MIRFARTASILCLGVFCVLFNFPWRLFSQAADASNPRRRGEAGPADYGRNRSRGRTGRPPRLR